jgi:5-methylcytosine-specific restriction endonuclease McrA
MFDSLICDYNYKCLDRQFCPHDTNCKIYAKLLVVIKRRYTTISHTKNQRGWTHDNASKDDIRKMYAESLRSGFKCPYCNTDMTIDSHLLNTASIDHVIARGLGGDNSLRNMKLCCMKCNRDKAVVESHYVTARLNGIVIK